jgi:hypothetical protein
VRLLGRSERLWLTLWKGGLITVTVNIDIVAQKNADGSLSYLTYKYKGSTVKIGLGYDEQGNLNKLLVPAFLNLKPEQIYNLVMQQYLERINHIGDIGTVDTITLLDTISIINLIKAAKVNILILKNGDFGRAFNDWILSSSHAPASDIITIQTVDTIDSPQTVQIIGQNNVIPDAISQRLYIGQPRDKALSFWGKASANTTLTIGFYGDIASDVQTVALTNVWTRFTVKPTVTQTLWFLSMSIASTLNTVLISDVDFVITAQTVTPKAEGKTTIIKSGAASGGTTALHTVTAGTVFYLTGCCLDVNASTAGNALVQFGGANLLGIIVGAVAGVANATKALSLAVPMPFPAGTVIQIVSSIATLQGFASIIGWEE